MSSRCSAEGDHVVEDRARLVIVEPAGVASSFIFIHQAILTYSGKGKFNPIALPAETSPQAAAEATAG